ncbi:sugar ABC transporter substrate-binding protein [Phytoactinopolyspora endophytica]|uniref:sugar ABC transporter substrate-binding protein n=1 Tax=Phytoactinopolyspora endophytica TaxID=1642495 RepID=UPI00101D32C5|nr:substrate-binding domain-containing protein [Phytoactinopolyspora endophytica]
MRGTRLRLAAGFATAGLLLAACGSDTDTTTESEESDEESSTTSDDSDDGDTPAGTVGVILPDSASSARWETADRPLLQEAFDAAGVEVDIQNAEGETSNFQTIADGMIGAGYAALLIVNLDSETGTAVISNAAAAGIPVIDYDRLTLGGGAEYYVSFDNVAVGTAIGEGLVTCLQEDGVDEGDVVLLNGSPTDNNATLFKEGYEAAVTEAGYGIADDQAVPDWDNTQAGTIFEQIFTGTGGDFVGVASANDGLGGAVISVLDRNGLAGEIPVTGQDATDEGLQRVLLGTQCVTVYKAIKDEADAAAALAVALATGDTDAADAIADGSVEDTETGEQVKSALLTPQPIFADTVKDVVADGFTTADALCTTEELQQACEEYGVE